MERGRRGIKRDSEGFLDGFRQAEVGRATDTILTRRVSGSQKAAKGIRKKKELLDASHYASRSSEWALLGSNQ